MKHEFKVTRSKEQTVYTLESATGGGTSVNAIASMDSELGGIQRRNPPGDNILAQEKKETPKPRNFVAKNAKMGGAGQHKDKKKAAKQGDVKHKKPLAEDDAGDVEQRFAAKMEKEKQRLEKLKQTDPEAYKREMEKRKTSSRIPPVSTFEQQGVAEGLPQTLRKVVPGYAKREIDKKMDAGKFGKTDADKDANFQRYKKIQDKLKEQGVAEEWSQKYKSSINCSHPKGFSQKAHCAGKKKHNESIEMEAVCPDCGMCETHGDNMMEVKQRLDAKCWKGKHKEGTKIKGGIRVNNCVPNEDVAEDHEIQMASSELQSIAKNAVHLLDLVRKYSEEEGLDAWQQSKITKAADYLNAVLQSISGEQTNLEGVGMPFRGVGGAFNRGDDERHDLDVPRPSTQVWALKINGQVDGNNVFNSREQALKHRLNLLAKNPGLEIGLVTKGGMPEDAYMESLQNMLERSVSQAQHNLMVAVAHNPQFAQKVKVKQKVGQEFANADQGHDISKLPIRVPKKK